jgi:integrase
LTLRNGKMRPAMKPSARSDACGVARDSAAAAQLARELVATIASGACANCAQVIDEYAFWMTKSGLSPTGIQTVGIFLRAFARNTGLLGEPVASITEDHISAWVNSPGSWKFTHRLWILRVINNWLGWCGKKGYCVGNRASLVRVRRDTLTHEQKEPGTRSPTSDADVSKLLDAAKDEPFWRVAILLGRDAGLRIRDVCLLEWASINTKPGCIVVHTHKTGSRVEIPLTDRLSSALSVVEKSDDRYVFPIEQKAASRTRNQRTHQQFKFILHRAGVDPSRTFHCLRHAFVSEHINQGSSVHGVAALVGHSNTSTTAGYYHWADPLALVNPGASAGSVEPNTQVAGQPKCVILASFSSRT